MGGCRSGIDKNNSLWIKREQSEGFSCRFGFASFDRFGLTMFSRPLPYPYSPSPSRIVRTHSSVFITPHGGPMPPTFPSQFSQPPPPRGGISWLKYFEVSSELSRSILLVIWGKVLIFETKVREVKELCCCSASCLMKWASWVFGMRDC